MDKETVWVVTATTQWGGDQVAEVVHNDHQPDGSVVVATRGLAPMCRTVTNVRRVFRTRSRAQRYAEKDMVRVAREYEWAGHKPQPAEPRWVGHPLTEPMLGGESRISVTLNGKLHEWTLTYLTLD